MEPCSDEIIHHPADIIDTPLRLIKRTLSFLLFGMEKWCPGAESNHRHEDFQSPRLKYGAVRQTSLSINI